MAAIEQRRRATPLQARGRRGCEIACRYAVFDFPHSLSTFCNERWRLVSRWPDGLYGRTRAKRKDTSTARKLDARSQKSRHVSNLPAQGVELAQSSGRRASCSASGVTPANRSGETSIRA